MKNKHQSETRGSCWNRFAICFVTFLFENCALKHYGRGYKPRPAPNIFSVNSKFLIQTIKLIMTSFYNNKELLQLGFGKVGNNVKLSKKASLYNPENIILGDNVRIDDFCVLSAGSGRIILGNYIHIACFCLLYGQEQIIMEDFTTLSSRVVIYTCSDDFSGSSLTNPTVPNKYRPYLIKGTVVIKKHVIVGTNSTILPNVTVGTGSSIGAHSLVTENLAEWGIYCGTPAKKVKERKQDLLELEKQFLGFPT